jgi:hypothetical protein
MSAPAQSKSEQARSLISRLKLSFNLIFPETDHNNIAR